MKFNISALVFVYLFSVSSGQVFKFSQNVIFNMGGNPYSVSLSCFGSGGALSSTLNSLSALGSGLNPYDVVQSENYLKGNMVVILNAMKQFKTSISTCSVGSYVNTQLNSAIQNLNTWDLNPNDPSLQVVILSEMVNVVEQFSSSWGIGNYYIAAWDFEGLIAAINS